jgi:hypothetical protein
MAEEFDSGFGDKPSRETEDIIEQIAKLLLRAVEKEVRGSSEKDKARGPEDDKDGVPKFIAKKLEAGPDMAIPLPEFADAPVFDGDEGAVERREMGKARDRKIRLWRRRLGPHPGAPKKEPRIPRGPKDIVGDDEPAELGIPVAPDAPDPIELPDLPVEIPDFVIPDFPAIAMPEVPERVREPVRRGDPPAFGGAAVEDVDNALSLTWSYDTASSPSPPSPPAVQPAATVAPPLQITEPSPPSPVALPPLTESPIETPPSPVPPVAFNDPPPANAPSPPPVSVPVATAQAPPLPDFTPSATEDRRESEDEGEFDDVAEVIRQHRSPDLPPLSRFQEKRRQYGGSTASDPYGAKEHVEQQQIEQASTQSVIDAVVAAQADIANRRNRQDTATLEIMERTAYRQADHERRLREINAASQRSVSTLTDQYVL